MSIRSLQVTDFRCIANATLDFDSAYSLIVGPNGSGKTSLLEAIYLLSRGRSFRGTRADRLVRHGQRRFVLFARVQRGEGLFRVGIQGGRGESEVRVNGVVAEGLAALAECFAAEVIDPEIHALIAEGPEERRRFLDYGVFHVKHGFLTEWRDYRRALRQRNAALREGRGWREIETWDRPLIDAGERVDRMRRDYVAVLGPGFSAIGDELVGAGSIACSYRPGWTDADSLAEALEAARDRDREQGTTTVGPHRADLRVEFGGRLARQQVSRGQQKMVASALVLAQTADMARRSDVRPVLLLDDPAAELDARSVATLMAQVRVLGTQVIVTALTEDSVSLPEPPAVFHVEQGTVSRFR